MKEKWFWFQFINNFIDMIMKVSIIENLKKSKCVLYDFALTLLTKKRALLFSYLTKVQFMIHLTSMTKSYYQYSKFKCLRTLSDV